jgi:hypothetical protein
MKDSSIVPNERWKGFYVMVTVSNVMNNAPVVKMVIVVIYEHFPPPLNNFYQILKLRQNPPSLSALVENHNST